MIGVEKDKRQEERIHAVLPVDLGNAVGLTSDVSASGMYFETSATFDAGSEIRFSVEFDAPVGKMLLNCRGYIVRTVMHENRLGVAVKIVDSVMEGSDTLSRRDQVAASR